ncbi:metal ABC transporter permease [Streptomyces sp. NY05-11A]|uniref:metal ABC transporter permease n=1 Tax=Streptomyces soliscabiei TaxID=588897 RepID=UPI0029A8F83F|nr:metal ABC transporter permease [Streptomyces sp. NY05-11A]MDX2679225.1 metal ABC transporter permease [Streptomyces sp. NY05-11A]
MNFWSDLVDPFDYAFFVNGCVVATITGALCGMTGVFITLRGMSYIGHGLSHAVFGGFAAASIIQFNYYIGAGIWGLVSALLINRVARGRSIGSDAAIGVVTTASFALGVALLTFFGSRGPSFDAALFGSIIGVRPTDVWIVVGVTVLTAILMTVRYRALLFTTFDPEVAAATGVKVGRIDALLMAVLSLAILSTLTVIGVTLVAATLVVPAVIARMIAPTFGHMVPFAALIGAVTGFSGMNLSYHANVPSGTMIVLVGGVIFTITYLITGRRSGVRRLSRAAG